MAQTAKTKFTIIGVIVAAIVIALVAWSYHKKIENSELVIGISPPFANPLKVAVEEAKQQGINVKLVEFSDWNTPISRSTMVILMLTIFSISPS